MKVGQLAEAAGVSVQTIRFYERRGLLPLQRAYYEEEDSQ
jgi:DNA-binding transcriptional MerR regulator